MATIKRNIPIWLLQRRDWRELRYPLAAAVIILIGYAPWLGNFWTAFSSNSGVDARPGTTGITALSVWLLNAYRDFGYREYGLPAVALLRGEGEHRRPPVAVRDDAAPADLRLGAPHACPFPADPRGSDP